MISAVPLHRVATGCFASETSSVSWERIFSDLGKTENGYCQSRLSSFVETAEIVRSFSKTELDTNFTIESFIIHFCAAKLHLMAN